VEARQAKSGELSIEIVSHCWNYAHFLAYQLSSLALYPPTRAHITMTVYYCEEDERTKALLAFFENQSIANVTWNWQAQPRAALFRRAIGRNEAALNTKADWIWFTDCDLMFRERCLDSLVEQLQGRTDALVFPRIERCTSLLSSENPMLTVDLNNMQLVDVDTGQFDEFVRKKATGPLQIAHGDIARACGYCQSIAFYQRPSEVWCKTYEDRAFRWLLRSQGVSLDVVGVYRIRLVAKGRYSGGALNSGLVSILSRFVSWVQVRL
jgi:hypothetical protein